MYNRSLSTIGGKGRFQMRTLIRVATSAMRASRIDLRQGFRNICGNTDFEVETPAGHLEPLERMHSIAAAKLKLSLQ